MSRTTSSGLDCGRRNPTSLPVRVKTLTIHKLKSPDPYIYEPPAAGRIHVNILKNAELADAAHK